MHRNDLNRILPSFYTQLMHLTIRRAFVWWRLQRMRMTFLCILIVTAVLMGAFDRYIFLNPAWYPINYMNTQMALALLMSVYSLRTYGNAQELPMVWREFSHGMSRPAFFIGRLFVDVLDMFIMSLFFGAMYFVVTAPDITFYSFMVPYVLVAYVSSGWGYVISCWLPFEFNSLGPFVSALLSFVFGGILGLPTQMGVFLSNPMYELIVGLTSFTRWGVPMIFFEYLRQADPKPESLKMKFFYSNAVRDYNKGWHLPGDDGYFATGTFAMVSLGTALRVLAFFGLKSINRSKQV